MSILPQLVFIAVLVNALIKREYVQKSTIITKSQQLLNNSNLLPFCIEVNLILVSIRTPCVFSSKDLLVWYRPIGQGQVFLEVIR